MWFEEIDNLNLAGSIHNYHFSFVHEEVKHVQAGQL